MPSEGFIPPKIYLRVGPGGSGHTNFIEDLAKACDLELFTHRGMTPRKFCYGPGSARFNTKLQRCKKKKMLAFDNCRSKDMCSEVPIVLSFHWDGMSHILDTIVLSVNDKGMKSSGEVDADEVLRHAFPYGDVEHCRLYPKITEIHHMLPDGTVRILASAGKKLQDPIVLSALECIERVRVQ
jgi:hypothetical protein